MTSFFAGGGGAINSSVESHSSSSSSSSSNSDIPVKVFTGSDILRQLSNISDEEREANFIISSTNLSKQNILNTIRSAETASSRSQQIKTEPLFKHDTLLYNGKFDEKGLRQLTYTLLTACSFLSSKDIAIGYIRPNDIVRLEHSIYALRLTGEECVFPTTHTTAKDKRGKLNSSQVGTKEQVKFCFSPELGSTSTELGNTVDDSALFSIPFEEFRAPDQIFDLFSSAESAIWQVGQLLLVILSGCSHSDLFRMNRPPVAHYLNRPSSDSSVKSNTIDASLNDPLYNLAYRSQRDEKLKYEYVQLLDSLMARRNIAISRDFSSLVKDMLSGDPSRRPSFNQCINRILSCTSSPIVTFSTADIKKVHSRKPYHVYIAKELDAKRLPTRQNSIVGAAGGSSSSSGGGGGYNANDNRNSIRKSSSGSNMTNTSNAKASNFGFSWLKAAWSDLMNGCSCDVVLDESDLPDRHEANGQIANADGSAAARPRTST